MISKRKEPLRLEFFTMIDPVTRWFKVTQYFERKIMMITNLVETTLLSRHPCPLDITHNSGSEFLGHEFKNTLNEMECGILAKPETPANLQDNSII